MRSKNTIYIFLAILTFITHQALAQSWNYQTYDSSSNAQSAPGYVTLEEKDGEYRFRIFAGKMTTCLRGELKATVERTESTITITTAPLFPGCKEERWVIRADGTGGTTAHKNENSEWVLDSNRDRKMTIKN